MNEVNERFPTSMRIVGLEPGFTIDEWKELKQHCDEVGLEFMSSPFSNAAVD